MSRSVPTGSSLDWFPLANNKTLPATHGSIQPWISELAKQSDSHSSFNELMDTPVDFFAFLMNRLKVETLTLELIAGPTYELMKGSCKSLESAHDVYSKRRIIDVTELKIVEWHNYKHLDWITMRRDDDKLYKFKEGDFKRLRIQDIEDMLLFLVQGKLTNLTVEERFAFNVSVRMLSRSIVIQRRMEDLQLGVKSYQKKLNLTRPDMYHSDHAGCLDSRKSTSGGIQFLGKDKLVSWSSKKQDCTSMSSVEAEYVSLSACCAQVLWIRTQLTDYGFHFDKIPMYCDSKPAIAISCNPVQHSRTKHIDVRYHFIKVKVKKGSVELFFVGTEYLLADLFTKALFEDRFKY
nr:retrovirus-related Pol polyprotein from transposon TNT 1-94 [Tanacetum cinerariifolium]